MLKISHQPKTIEHIISNFPILAGTDYTERHNIVAKIIHQAITQKYFFNNSENDTPYYKYQPENIIENEIYKIYWDRTIFTDKTIPHNRPDITIKNKTEKTTYLIEISVPSDNNITQKYNEKITKYLDLAEEIKRIWKQQKVTILPFIISATGITHKSFINNLKTLNITPNTHTIAQKAVILKTCNIVRKFLNQQ